MENSQETQGLEQMKGYRIAVIALAVVLAVLSIVFFTIHSQQKADYELLNTDRAAIQENLTNIIGEFDDLKTDSDKLRAELKEVRAYADSVSSQLESERSLNYTKLRQYQREINTLRSMMRGYLAQIDSLNALNQDLLDQNVSYKKSLSETELRAQKAEELAEELAGKVRMGSRIIAQGIEIAPLNKKGREISRIKRAKSISINFTVVANTLAKPGKKTIYAAVTSPDGYVVTTEAVPSFSLDGKKTTYTASREIQYANKELPVSIFFEGEGFVSGTYQVDLYSDDALIGTTKLEMR